MMSMNQSKKIEEIKVDENEKPKKRFIIYPDFHLMKLWELTISLILLMTCIVTPLDIALPNTSAKQFYDVFNIISDLMFLADMIVNFCTAYYDEEMEIVDDRKKIAKRYVYSWFFVDFLAIFPFSALFNTGDQYNELIRVTRLGKISRIIKLLRLVRIIKVIRN